MNENPMPPNLHVPPHGWPARRPWAPPTGQHFERCQIHPLLPAQIAAALATLPAAAAPIFQRNPLAMDAVAWQTQDFRCELGYAPAPWSTLGGGDSPWYLMMRCPACLGDGTQQPAGPDVQFTGMVFLHLEADHPLGRPSAAALAAATAEDWSEAATVVGPLKASTQLWQHAQDQLVQSLSHCRVSKIVEVIRRLGSEDPALGQEVYQAICRLKPTRTANAILAQLL